MKYQSVACFTNALLGLALLLPCSAAFGQSSTDKRKCEDPGSTIVFTVKISGPHVEQVVYAGLDFERTPSPLDPSQETLPKQLQSQHVTIVVPGTLEVPVLIPEYAAPGEYTLRQLDISNGGPVGQSFKPPEIAPPSPIIVCNAKTFGPFKADSVTRKP
jgi:hypothetical protein